MGRKKQPGVKRTASGRKSRAHDAYQENLEPILTRMRLFGLSEKDARDQKASTFIGRLNLMHAITLDQYHAAQDYLRVREAFQRAVKSPDALRSSNGGGDQGESPTYAAWCRNAIAKYEQANKAIMDAQCAFANRGRNLHAALDYLVCRNEEHWHLVDDCRVALSVLVDHFARPRRHPHPANSDSMATA